MELVTASDLVVTASLAFLLSFIVAKLVSLAIPTDPHTTNHVNKFRHVSGEPFTVQTAPMESKFEFQVATNVEETEHNAEEQEETTVESNVVELSVTSKEVSEVDVLTEKATQEFEFDPQQAVGSDDNLEDSAEQRKTDCICVEEISSVVEERDDDDDDDDDDDWEGIERSELEKVFMEATEFVESDGLGIGGSDVQMELYGLHKVATEGPCRLPQPMPLKLFARAKWNAWQKLGTMSPEVAMEQYISIVSDKVPGWMKDTSAGMSEHEPAESGVSESVAADLSTSLSHQQLMLTDRELEQVKESSAQDRSPLTESNLENNVKK